MAASDEFGHIEASFGQVSVQLVVVLRSMWHVRFSSSTNDM